MTDTRTIMLVITVLVLAVLPIRPPSAVGDEKAPPPSPISLEDLIDLADKQKAARAKRDGEDESSDEGEKKKVEPVVQEKSGGESRVNTVPRTVADGAAKAKDTIPAPADATGEPVALPKKRLPPTDTMLPVAPLNEETAPSSTEYPFSFFEKTSYLISPLGTNLDTIGVPAVLPEEGSVVFARIAAVRPEKHPQGSKGADTPAADAGPRWHVAHFEPMPRKRNIMPHRLLRCRLLKAVEEALVKDPDTRFTMTGITTVFRDRPYLMLRRVQILPPLPAEPEKKTSAAKTKDTADAEPAAPAPRAAGKSGKTPEESAADELIRGLIEEDRLGRPVLNRDMDGRSEKESGTVVPRIAGKPISSTRSFVVNRVVRIVEAEGGRWYVAGFIGDNSMREPPMRVHPSSLLQKAIYFNGLIGRDTYTRNVIVTGEVSEYEGRKYLLIRKLLRQRNLGRF